jgi:hypothetical protein
MTEEIKHWKTKRGGAGIIHERFIHNCHYNKNKRWRWRCNSRLCFGVLFTDIETVYIFERRFYRHGPETILEKGIMIKKYMYDEKSSIYVPFTIIIIELYCLSMKMIKRN